jgi:hypothetical protein
MNPFDDPLGDATAKAFGKTQAKGAAQPTPSAAEHLDDDELDGEYGWDETSTQPDSSATQNQPADVLQIDYGEEALVPPPVQNTVVRGILHKGSITLIFGMPKSGKSFLATDLALAVADDSRANWMGHRIMQHGPVLYVACEGHGGFWKRLRAMIPTDQLAPEQFALARGRPKLIIDPEAKGYTWVPHPDDVTQACNRVHAKLHKPPVLVVIDTVFRSFGGANVNDSAHMNAYVAAAQEIADCGIAVLLVHHTTKTNNTPAGSVSLIGAADTLVKVEKNKDNGSHVWEVQEAKDDAETPPREFTLEVVDGIPDAFREYVSSCRVIDRGTRKHEAKPSKAKKEAEPKPRGANAENIFMALMGLFAKPGVAQEREIVSGKPKLPSVTRDQLRDHLKAAGLIDGTKDGGMTATDRSRLHKGLVALFERGEIVMTERAIAWTPPQDATAAARPTP